MENPLSFLIKVTEFKEVMKKFDDPELCHCIVNSWVGKIYKLTIEADYFNLNLRQYQTEISRDFLDDSQKGRKRRTLVLLLGQSQILKEHKDTATSNNSFLFKKLKMELDKIL